MRRLTPEERAAAKAPVLLADLPDQGPPAC